MIALETKDIGGGIVRRTFRSGDVTLFAGNKLTRDQIMAWPFANRRALIENRFIEVYPAAPASSVIDKMPYAEIAAKAPMPVKAKFGRKSIITPQN